MINHVIICVSFQVLFQRFAIKKFEKCTKLYLKSLYHALFLLYYNIHTSFIYKICVYLQNYQYKLYQLNN